MEMTRTTHMKVPFAAAQSLEAGRIVTRWYVGTILGREVPKVYFQVPDDPLAKYGMI